MSTEESQWMDYAAYRAEKQWLEFREMLFMQMVADGIPPWEFRNHIEEYEQKNRYYRR